MKTTKKTGLVLSALAFGMLFACSKNDEVVTESVSTEKIEQPSELNKLCAYVDANWSSTAVLSTTIGTTTAETTFMNTQNSKIATLWGRSAVTLRFVKDATTPSSTYNAISYSTGKIYYGEAIYKDALAKNSNNIVNAMILAHEFGHQLQYAYGLPSVTETTARSSELEADGFAGYYLRRPTGWNATSFTQISSAYDFAYAIGDYSTTSAGHHGTPPQRKSAVRLGFLLGQYTLTASSFDYNFFYYYTGVLNGTYRKANSQYFDPKIDAYIKSHAEELRRIQSGEMSDEEFKNLD
jgi:uncharacterized protein